MHVIGGHPKASALVGCILAAGLTVVSISNYTAAKNEVVTPLSAILAYCENPSKDTTLPMSLIKKLNGSVCKCYVDTGQACK
jgi:hypothetical protein